MINKEAKSLESEFKHQVLGYLLKECKSAVNSIDYQVILSYGLELLDEPKLIFEHNPELSELLRSSQFRHEVISKLEKWRSLGISAIGLTSPSYPEKLRAIYKPPPILFYFGQWLNEWPKTLAMVGSRSADKEGCENARYFACEVAKANVCVISGLALGIDGHSHQGAIEAELVGCKTVAVLGNGLPAIYPRRHEALAKQILRSGGLIISQFDPDTPAYPANFLDRNRIIAGLSDSVMVVQANKRSGSLVTARYALEEGRGVITVPGSISNPLYEGNNYLIKQGAGCILNVEDIYLELGVDKPARVNKPDLSQHEKNIISFLAKHGSVTATKLREALKSPDLELMLLELENKGLLKRAAGDMFHI